MAKKQDSTEAKRKWLKQLLVLRSIEKTDRYDTDIARLQSEIDFIDYGIE